MRLRILYTLSLLYPLNSHAEPVIISDFSTQTLSDWQQESFAGHTQYQIVDLNKQAVLQAKSLSSASSLYKEVRIDLYKTPYLNWSWRKDQSLSIDNEQSKQGDDFSARIYLIVKGKWGFWQSKAINYVWANHSPINTAWANPFAGDNVMMIAIRSQNDQNKQWYTEKRDVLADFKSLFGEDIQFLDGVAIMTDSDNSEGSALSYYANIYFSEK